MRSQRRLGGSSPGHATAIGAEDYTGKGICFPQTLHLAQAKVPDQSLSLLELRVSRTFLDQLRPQLSGHGRPTKRAASTSCPRLGRFWLLELRVSRTFLDQLRSQLSGHGYPAR